MPLEDHEDTVSIGGRTIMNLRFADDINGLAEEEELEEGEGKLCAFKRSNCHSLFNCAVECELSEHLVFLFFFHILIAVFDYHFIVIFVFFV